MEVDHLQSMRAVRENIIDSEMNGVEETFVCVDIYGTTSDVKL